MSKLIKRTELSHSMGEGKVKEILSLPREEQRYLYYKNDIERALYNFTVDAISEFDDKICFSSITSGFRFNCGLYTLPNKKCGFTYTKDTGKIKIWFGGNIKDIVYNKSFDELLNYYKLDWLTNEKFLYNFITRTTLEKIFSGKITNPIKLCDNYIKTSLKAKIPPKLFYNLFKKTSEDDTNSVSDLLVKFNRSLSVSSNNENLIRYYSNRIGLSDNNSWGFINHSHSLGDLISQCLILDKKIDFSWSDKRIETEHTKLTNMIIEIEIKHVGDEIIEYNGNLNLLNNCTILSSKKDVFIEGKTQSHCIYTNYWSRVKRKEYFVIKMNYPERCTIGIRMINKIFKVDQMYKIRNNTCKQETRDIIDQWLTNQEVQDFFIDNSKI